MNKEAGSTLLMTTIILLLLSIMVASSMTLSDMALGVALFKKNTNNNYYLAKSAVLKQLDRMNEDIEYEIVHIIEDKIAPYYIDRLVNETKEIKYDTNHLILTVNKEEDSIEERIKQEVYDYLVASYVGKKIRYKVQGEREEKDDVTEVKIEVVNRDEAGSILKDKKLYILATVETTTEKTEVYDSQVVEAVVNINIPEQIKNQIHEKYEWAEGIPELLKSGVLCYSDILVKDNGSLQLEGDVRVGGEPNIQEISKEDTVTYPKVSETGGILALNGGIINFMDNVYCTRNILISGGCNEANANNGASIYIGQDAIANTIGIINDDSNEKMDFIQNAQITIGQNAMVDNDVRIDRFVKDSSIKIKKTLFGVSGGTTSATENPNQSSGVFAQGEGCLIEAGRMYVAGQPFIIFDNHRPVRLWESIGEPFDGVASWFGYKIGEEQVENKSYLEEDSPFKTMIAADKIKTNLEHTFAIAKVSAINTKDGSQNRGVVCQADLGNPVEAWKFFFQEAGANGKKIEDLMDQPIAEDYKEEMDIVLGKASREYLRGNLEIERNGAKETYCRNLGPVLEHTYEGLKGYMSLKRAILYQENTCKKQQALKEAYFSQIIDLNQLPSKPHKWCYETPIEVVSHNFSTLKVSDYYINEEEEEKPYPTLIINPDSKVALKITAQGEKNTLKGWIISNGPVELGKGIKIEGGIIIGGPENTILSSREIDAGHNAGLIVSEGNVQIIHNPEVLLKIEAKDSTLYRDILDALHLTNYSEGKVSDVMAKQAPYTKKALRYSNQSIFEVDIQGVELSVQSLRKK